MAGNVCCYSTLLVGKHVHLTSKTPSSVTFNSVKLPTEGQEGCNATILLIAGCLVTVYVHFDVGSEIKHYVNINSLIPNPRRPFVTIYKCILNQASEVRFFEVKSSLHF